jgi:hypothetical protein
MVEHGNGRTMDNHTCFSYLPPPVVWSGVLFPIASSWKGYLYGARGTVLAFLVVGSDPVARFNGVLWRREADYAGRSKSRPKRN